MLDEPTNGLDVLATRALRDSLRWLRTPEGGAKCIVFSTHIMQEVERLCDRVVVVAQGRTVATGTVAELLRADRAERLRGSVRAVGASVIGGERAPTPQSRRRVARGAPMDSVRAVATVLARKCSMRCATGARC